MKLGFNGCSRNNKKMINARNGKCSIKSGDGAENIIFHFLSTSQSLHNFMNLDLFSKKISIFALVNKIYSYGSYIYKT